MREPPIVNQENVYSDQFGSSSSIPQFQEPRVPTGSRKPVLIVLGLGTCVLLAGCGGLFAWIYTSLNAGSEMSAEYREHRELTGSEMPSALIARINDSVPQNSDDIESLRGFLDALQTVEDVDEVVDYARVVDEMQASGLSSGLNSLTKAFWIGNIRGAVELPVIGDRYEILDFEWLFANEEARAIVASFTAWEDDPRILFIYVTRRDGQWKLYDSRDVLVPMSEAQYLAAYVAAPEGIDDNFIELAEELAEINVSEDENSKASRSLAAFRRRSYAKSMRSYAESITGDYLQIYEDVEALKAFCSSLSDAGYAGSQLVKGRLAVLENDKAEAYHRAKQLMDLVGWHPTAALMAGDAAVSDEEKRQAAQWLAKSVIIAPNHSLSLESFFAIANEDQQRQLLLDLNHLPDGKTRFVELCSSLSEERLQPLADIASEFSALSTAVDFAKLIALEPADDSQRELVIELANRVLASPEYSELFETTSTNESQTYDAGPSQELWRKLLDAALAPGMLDTALASSKDRGEFLQHLRKRISEEWYLEADWDRVLRVLQAETDSKNDTLAEVAVGVALYHLDRYAEAASQLLPVIVAQRDELLDFDDPPAYSYTLMDAASTSAIKSQQVPALREAIDEPESAFVVLAANMLAEEQERQLEDLVGWYATANEAPQLWRYYYQAQLDYARGDWPAADENMAKAIELGEADTRLKDFSIRSVVYDFAPIIDYVSEWAEERVSLAIRCGQLDELIRKVEDANQFESDYAYSISYAIDHETEPAQVRRITALIRATGDEYLVGRSYSLLSRLEVDAGNYQSAMDNAIAAAVSIEGDETYGNHEYGSAVRLLATFGQWDHLATLEDLGSGNDDKQMFTALVALHQGRQDAFVAAIDSYENEYRRRFWFANSGLIAAQKQAGVWKAANAKYAVAPDSLASEVGAAGVLLLDRPATDILVDLASAFGSLSTNMQSISKESFPNSVDGWYADIDAGRLIVVAYDNFAADTESGVPERVMDTTVGVLGLAIVQPPGHSSPTRRIREVAVEFGRHVSAVNGYIDYTSDSWFLANQSDENWRDRLSASLDFGVDPRSPQSHYFPWNNYGRQETGNPDRIGIRVGLILEELHVQPEASSESEPNSVLQDAPVLIPVLAPGDRLRYSS